LRSFGFPELALDALSARFWPASVKGGALISIKWLLTYEFSLVAASLFLEFFCAYF